MKRKVEYAIITTRKLQWMGSDAPYYRIVRATRPPRDHEPTALHASITIEERCGEDALGQHSWALRWSVRYIERETGPEAVQVVGGVGETSGELQELDARILVALFSPLEWTIVTISEDAPSASDKAVGPDET